MLFKVKVLMAGRCCTETAEDLKRWICEVCSKVLMCRNTLGNCVTHIVLNNPKTWFLMLLKPSLSQA